MKNGMRWAKLVVAMGISLTLSVSPVWAQIEFEGDFASAVNELRETVGPELLPYVDATLEKIETDDGIDIQAAEQLLETEAPAIAREIQTNAGLLNIAGGGNETQSVNTYASEFAKFCEHQAQELMISGNVREAAQFVAYREATNQAIEFAAQAEKMLAEGGFGSLRDFEQTVIAAAGGRDASPEQMMEAARGILGDQFEHFDSFMHGPSMEGLSPDDMKAAFQDMMQNMPLEMMAQMMNDGSVDFVRPDGSTLSAGAMKDMWEAGTWDPATLGEGYFFDPQAGGSEFIFDPSTGGEFFHEAGNVYEHEFMSPEAMQAEFERYVQENEALAEQHEQMLIDMQQQMQHPPVENVQEHCSDNHKDSVCP